LARARAAGAPAIWAFGTGAMRAAADGEAFAREVEAAAGVPCEVLSGAREAELAYRAARPIGGGPLLVADVGGRTTELTLGVEDSVLAAASLPLGALALTEAHGLGAEPSRASLEALAAAVDVVLAANDVPRLARARRARLVVSGGSATALAALDLGLDRWDGRRVHGHTLAAPGLATRFAIARADALEPGRAAILPAGAVVLERIAAAAGVTQVVVSTHGVRHAYLADRLAAAGVTADLRAI